MRKTLTSIIAIILLHQGGQAQLIFEYDTLEICSGVATEIGVPAQDGYTYVWPPLAAISSPTTSLTFFTIESGAPEVYDMDVTLREFDIDGVLSRLVLFNLIILPRVFTSTTILEENICTGDTVFLQRESWWPDQLSISPQTYISFDLIDSVYAMRPIDSTQYNFSFINQEACIEQTWVVEIYVQERPVVSISSPETLYCSSDTNLYTFDFFPPEGGLFFGAGINQNGVFNPQLSPSGERRVIYTVSTAGCATSDTTIFYVYGENDVQLDEVPNLCQSAPAIELNYAVPPGGIYSIDGTPTDSIFPANLNPGQHIIEYFIEIGESCLVNVDGVFNIIPTPPSPTISFAPDTIVCTGDTVRLTSSSFSNYLWHNDSTSQSISVTASVLASVSAVSNLGCISTPTSLQIIVADSLKSSIELSSYPSGFPISVFNAADGTASLTLTGGYAPFNISWSTGDTNTYFLTNLDTGWYYLDVNDRAGCATRDSFFLNQPDEIIPPGLNPDFGLPNAFTPNNDGFNDSYKINGLTGDLLSNSFEVYNLSRILVYKAENYDNSWTGTDLDNNVLPPGTYFAIFTSEKAGVRVRTYIDIRR
jgi:gliding motility-associated-like protein